jgi:hypothetical protein
MIGEQYTQTMWVLLDTDSNGSPDVSSTQSVNIDLRPPPSPDSDTDHRWPRQSGADRQVDRDRFRDLPDLVGYQVLCRRGADLQVFTNDTFDPGFQSCTTPTTRTSDDRHELRRRDRIAEPLFACSPLLSPTTDSFRVKILQNDITYGVAVVSIDNSRNASTPDILYGVATHTKSFYDVTGTTTPTSGRGGRRVWHAGAGANVARALRRCRRGGRDRRVRPARGGGGDETARRSRARGSPSLGAARRAARARAAPSRRARSTRAIVRPALQDPPAFRVRAALRPLPAEMDSEFDGTRTLQGLLRGGAKLMTQTGVRLRDPPPLRTVAVGAGIGYFSALGTSPVATAPASEQRRVDAEDHPAQRVAPSTASTTSWSAAFRWSRTASSASTGLLAGHRRQRRDRDRRPRRRTAAAEPGAGTRRRVSFALDFIDPEAARDFDTSWASITRR